MRHVKTVTRFRAPFGDNFTGAGTIPPNQIEIERAGQRRTA
jgi:hypothetical protein